MKRKMKYGCLPLIVALMLVACTARIPDSQLHSTIVSRLAVDDGFRSVTVAVNNGVVTLSGSVSNDSAKTLAATYARVDDVTEIKNNIAVIPPTPEPTPEIASIPEEFEPDLSLYDEAVAEAQKFVDENSVQCGDVYYLLSNDYLWACKHPLEVEVNGKEFEPRELSEADKLNNVDPLPVQWKGSFKINLTLCRTMSLGPASYKTWSEWRDKDSHKPKAITKAKGTWTITNESDYGQGGKIRKLLPKYCRNDNQIEFPEGFFK